MAVYRPYHVDIERETQLMRRGMVELHHVDTRERLHVYFHGKLTEDQSALFYHHLNLATQHFAVVGGVSERVVPFAVRSPVQLLHRRNFMALG
jgi:hypothetical protein